MGRLEEEILLQMVNDFIELGSSPTRDTNTTTTVTPDHDDHTKCYILQEIVESRNGVESRVVESVLKHMRDKMECDEKSCGGLKKWLIKRLRMDGFSASLCHSSWPTTLSCPGGAYEYIEVVVVEEAKQQRGIIDIDFKSQFEVARPTPSYKRLLQILPQIFVGEEDKLRRTLSILCSEAKCSLTQNGLHIPPWRTATYMRFKWLSSTQISTITIQTCC
ncbi:PREDICTED: uncharacterized protein LOC109193319 [Ipomoea nil]|uniref:uncharacterized protein LOC109193319 n=1 Tax=Ipomoea nil TaxID=35883 RepID=UPI0009018205|nr:PREDICTED: uncharacterized protein LOC109193319 [Ipomoea nil]